MNVNDLNKNNIKDFFDSMASSWDDGKADEVGAKKIVKQFKSKIKNKKVLDIGCGTGVLYPSLKKAEAAQITCIDMSPKMIEIAKEKFPEANFICEDVINWKTEQKFDTIIMYNVYPHLTNVDDLVRKISKLLVPHGSFIVAHGSSREQINAHHSSHAMEISRKLLKAQVEAEAWRELFDVEIIRDNELYYFSGKKRAH